MNVATSSHALSSDSVLEDNDRLRFPVYGDEPTALADVYRKEVNIAIWHRSLSEPLRDAVKEFLKAKSDLSVSRVVSPQDASAIVSQALDSSASPLIAEDVASLVEMFCDLFELKCAGLRLATIDRAMCPRFHVDRVPCRLITTYQGVATEWLRHEVVDRTKLGPGNAGRPDHESGVYRHENDIQRLDCGDVALLKGESWVGNENGGLVHRSPEVPSGERRLLLTLDVSG